MVDDVSIVRLYESFVPIVTLLYEMFWQYNISDNVHTFEMINEGLQFIYSGLL